jgi:hypothetical protein
VAPIARNITDPVRQLLARRLAAPEVSRALVTLLHVAQDPGASKGTT